MTLELLSRLQFALTIAFHYLFPPLSIGFGLFLVIMEGTYLRTGNQLYHEMTRFWVKIFGLIFALGVATGIVMEFQFGTNWATYSRFVGDVFGSALAAEGMFAFFLESGFLAILLFGWDKVKPTESISSPPPRLPGRSLFRPIWIVVANSWQQTPAGYHMVAEGIRLRAEIVDFWAVVFNPSFVDRISHVLWGLAGRRLPGHQRQRVLPPEGNAMRFRPGLHPHRPGRGAARLVAAAGDGSCQRPGRREEPAGQAGRVRGPLRNQDAGRRCLSLGWVDEAAETARGIAVPGMLS